MSPIDAAMREITIEMDKLAQRIGNGAMPDRITVEIEMDQRTGMPKAVEVEEHRRRHIQGGAVATRNNGIRPNDLRSVAPLTR